MPLVAALTPAEHIVSHTDEVVESVRFDVPVDLVGITAPTPSALHNRVTDYRRIISNLLATVSMVVPMPGTQTFHRLNADKRILTTDWSRYDGKKHCVFQPARMSPRELEAGTEWVGQRFYSARSILRRLSGSQAGVWWNLPRNVGYMLAGRWNSGPVWDPAAAPS